MMLGVRPNDTRPAPHSVTTANLISARPRALLILGPRIIQYISSEGGLAADSHEAAPALRSCMLVCRAWNPVARSYLQNVAVSCILSLAIRQLESSGEYPKFSGPPAVCPFLHAARSIFYNPLPKVPAGVSFSFVTLITLGSGQCGRVAISCVDSLCRAIASLEPLRNLQLEYCAWADSESYHTQLPVTSSSRARLHRIGVVAERSWLLDIRSAHFITWMVRSKTASELKEVHFEWMMLLEGQLLAAVAAVINASKGSLRWLLLSVGPDLAMHSLVQPLSHCVSLCQLAIFLPYHTTAFYHLTAFLATLHLRQPNLLDLRFQSHPSCTEPPAIAWQRLDTMLQTPWYHRLERVTVLEMGVDTGSSTVAWGDVYHDSRYDPVACRREMATLLPLTHGRHRLFYWENPYGRPERVPSRVRPFLPVEVAERIMDFIAGTKTTLRKELWSEGVPATLAACSLTCRAWRPRAQAHLFRVVSLSSASSDPCNIRGFLSFLANHPALSPFIRTCTVRDTPSPPAKIPSLHNAPFQLPGMIPQLEHLRLLVGTFYPPPRIAFDACMRLSSSIVRLWIHEVAFYSVSDLRRMVSACRNAKDLRLMDCMWRGISKPTIAGLQSPTSVRLAEVSVFGETDWTRDVRSASFLRWLAHSGALISAHTVYLPPFIADAGDMLTASQSAIDACRSTLTILRLGLSPDIDYSSFSGTLASCVELNILAIHLPYDSSSVSRLAEFLATEALHTRSRQGLNLRVTFETYLGCAAPTADDWHGLDNAFQIPAHEFLGAVAIRQWSLDTPEGSNVVWGNSYQVSCVGDEDFRDELKTLLPRTYERQLLWWYNPEHPSGAAYVPL